MKARKKPRRILPHHMEEFKNSGISQVTLRKAGIRSVTASEAKELTGLDIGPGWAVQYGHPNDSERPWCVKPDTPYQFEDGRTAKYIWPIGCPNRFHFPPGHEEWENDASNPLIFTEGSKKVLAATEAGFPAIGIHGVWNWIHDKKPISDFKRLNLRHRTVSIVFDSDVVTNSSVRLAQLRLAARLQKKSAKVVIVTLEPFKDGSKCGLDDFIADNGTEAFNQKLAEAQSIVDWEVNRLMALPDNERTQEAEELLVQVGKVFSEMAAEDFILAIHRKTGISKKALKSAVKRGSALARKSQEAAEITREYLDELRDSTGLSQDTKIRRISELVLQDLQQRGKLLNADSGIFFLESATGNVLDVETGEFSAFAYDHYGTNQSSREWRHIIAEVRDWTRSYMAPVTVREFCYYDPSINLLYIYHGNKGNWRLDGRRRTLVPNGDDGVFLRSGGHAPVDPVHGDKDLDAWESCVFRYMNIDERSGITEEQARLLVRVWVLSIFFLDALPTRPILTLIGAKGSGKTTVLKAIGKALLGPTFQVNLMPVDRPAMELLLGSYRLVVFDNNDSKNSDRVLDLLALVATGGQTERRILYTTRDTLSIKLDCLVAMTSHKPSFSREDIAERLLLLRTARLGEFIPEQSIMSTIANERGILWEELLVNLNRIVKRLSRAVDVQRTSPFRMADFAAFGFRALSPKESSAWEAALEALDESQRMFALDKDSVAKRLVLFLHGKPKKEIRSCMATQLADEARCNAVRLGKRLNDEADPIHNWVYVERRIVNGTSMYSLKLTDAGRRAAKFLVN